MKGDYNDPKALIRESFNIEGINIEECRSIFLDWALSLPNDVDAKKIIPLLIEKIAEMTSKSANIISNILPNPKEVYDER